MLSIFLKSASFAGQACATALLWWVLSGGDHSEAASRAGGGYQRPGSQAASVFFDPQYQHAATDVYGGKMDMQHFRMRGLIQVSALPRIFVHMNTCI